MGLDRIGGRWPALGAAWLAMRVGAALAQTAPVPPVQTLPTLALEPAPVPSIWHGLLVGTEVVGVTGRHGGVGGDVFASYDHAFTNGMVLGIEGTTGYLPSFASGRIVKGFDFAEADVKVGYDMGRLMPFIVAGVGLARPHLAAGLDPPGTESLNRVLNGAGETRALTSVGAGVDYAITDSLTVGFAVRGIQGRGPAYP